MFEIYMAHTFFECADAFSFDNKNAVNVSAWMNNDIPYNIMDVTGINGLIAMPNRCPKEISWRLFSPKSEKLTEEECLLSSS